MGFLFFITSLIAASLHTLCVYIFLDEKDSEDFLEIYIYQTVVFGCLNYILIYLILNTQYLDQFMH